MSVKIARLKNGDDIISDIKEVYSKETNKLAGIQLADPYLVDIIEDTANLFQEGDEPFKRSNPKVGMYPWGFLCHLIGSCLLILQNYCVFMNHTKKF